VNTKVITGLLVLFLWATPAIAGYKDLVLIEALDKITGRVFKLEVSIGSEVQFGRLRIKPRKCFQSPPEEPPESIAFLEISETRENEEAKKLFSGWMFSSSPGLSTLEHSVYDLIVLECYSPSSTDPVPSVTIESLPPALLTE